MFSLATSTAMFSPSVAASSWHLTAEGRLFFFLVPAGVAVGSGLVVASRRRGFEEPSPVMNSSYVLRRSESLTYRYESTDGFSASVAGKRTSLIGAFSCAMYRPSCANAIRFDAFV